MQNQTDEAFLRPTQTVDEWLKDCKIMSPKIIGDHFIGLYQVAYGIRVRAGELHSGHCAIDLCCGDDYNDVLTALAIYTKKMGKNYEEGNPILEGLRSGSDPKPYPKDKQFMHWFCGLVGELAIDKQLESVK